MIQKLKDINPLLVKLIAVIFVILLCFIVSAQIFYWKLCTDQDRNIPPNTEVIVSSCKRPTVIGVPGGEVLFVHEELTDSMYMLDLSTGEEREVLNDPLLADKDRVVFLSPELAWFERRGWDPNYPNYSPDYILDLTDGQRYELLDLMSLPRLGDGNFNPVNYSYIESADRLFIDPYKNRLIALSVDFRDNQKGRVILSGHVSDDDEFLLELIKTLGMDYENVDSSRALLHPDKPSPTGKLYVLNNRIYFSNTDMLSVAIPYPYYFRSWYYDESGVVIHDDYGTYWLQPRYLGEYGLNMYHLSYPVLKLRLPAR